MKTVLQRVSHASVTVDDPENNSQKKVTGEIQSGILVLVGFSKGDDESHLAYHLKKIPALRIFPDENGKMNRSVTDINGGLLIVSQFTLAGDCKKGTRPSFDKALPPQEAKALYDEFIRQLKSQTQLNIQSGIFGAMMDVSLRNDGPVTLILESQQDQPAGFI